MTRRRILIVALVALLAAMAARIAAPAPAHPVKFQRAFACGTERWTVKTLQDRPRLLARQATTVAHLVSLPAPAHLPQTRLPFERHVFRVTAAVALVQPQADGDLHLYLVSGRSHMIAETPNTPFCTPRATTYRKRQMKAARRQAVRVCARAQVTGVAFFDYLDGQIKAPNGIELHPVLGFSCLSGRVD